MGAEALLLIDIQCGYFSGWPRLYQPERFLNVVSKLVDKAHANGVAVVYTRFLGEAGNRAEAGTPGCEIHPQVAPGESDWVVNKRSTDCFRHSGLQEHLDSLGVSRLYITGCVSELCVDTTCRTAVGLGYHTTLVADGHATVDVHLAGVSPRQRTELMNLVLSRVGTAERMVEVQPAAQIHFTTQP